jgi:hypothetical protein
VKTTAIGIAADTNRAAGILGRIDRGVIVPPSARATTDDVARP